MMPRGTAVLALLVFVGCGSSGPTQGTVEGLITDVSARSVTVVPDGGGEPQTFVNGALQQVPLTHLVEHLEKKLPVILHWETRDGDRVAVRIDDA